MTRKVPHRNDSRRTARPPLFAPDGAPCAWPQGQKPDDDPFYHPEGERGRRRRERENRAKAICAKCPLIQPCQTEALANREGWGTWGGLTEDDRVAIYAATPKPLQLPDWIERELMPA